MIKKPTYRSNKEGKIKHRLNYRCKFIFVEALKGSNELANQKIKVQNTFEVIRKRCAKRKQLNLGHLSISNMILC